MANSYEKRGASAHKGDVVAALKGRDKGLFPTAFCRIAPDILGGDPAWCSALHADGVGTKSIIAHLLYQEKKDAAIYRTLAQDSLVMNLDDLLCIGATGPFLVSNTIGRNKAIITADILAEIIGGYYGFAERMEPYGLEFAFSGGETADLGDLVRTVVIDSTIAIRMRRDQVIDAGKTRVGDVIVGLASFGKASYEDSANSGIGTNGFTAARHELLHKDYLDQHPESFAPETAAHAYKGEHHLGDRPDGLGMTIGEALLSPTRCYAPLILPLLSKGKDQISAMFHNTGGGLTKCLPFGQGVRYVKDALFPRPKIFDLIQESGQIPERDMAQIFNLGQRFEIVCRPDFAGEIIKTAQNFNIAAQIIGRVEKSELAAEIVITGRGESLNFRRD